jgi:hypothetical protein
MLKNVSRPQLIAAWFAALIVLFALSVIWGAQISVGSAELWLFVGLAPPAVMLLVWHPPSKTVAETLYDATHAGRQGHP